MLQGHTEVLDRAGETMPVSAYHYFVYGMSLYSEIPLALPDQGYGELGQIELRFAPASFFSEAARSLRAQPQSESFYQFAGMRDGSSYVRWEGVGEFLISADGSRITGRQFDGAHGESFQVYLLGQALSFALVKKGCEPLHATTVVVNEEAIVFLGNSGFGKSSLAACFLAGGYRVLTDDLLVLQPFGDGFLACPGPPRIKLFPRLARRFLGHVADGVAMNGGTRKLILPLGPARSCAIPVPLRAIYALLPPRGASRTTIRIAVLPPREGFMALVQNTFNSRITHSARLERQFTQTARVVSAMPVKKVSYPRVLAQLPAVRGAILADLNASDGQATCAD